MLEVLDTAASRSLDRLTVQSGRISEVGLMRNAGRAVAIEAALMVNGDRNKGIAVVCGKGHNGGDGIAAAGFLNSWGYPVQTLLTGTADELDSVVAEIFAEAGIEVTENALPDTTPLAENTDLIIDALLGIGVDQALRAPVSDWVGAINAHPARVLAIDVPSGLSADIGEIKGAAVQADLTVTMGHHKIGLLVASGPDYAGTIKVADIGFTSGAFDDDKMRYFLFGRDDFDRLHRPPGRRTYKHRQGKCLVIAGSQGMTGAAQLTAQATMLSGAGLTVAPCPASLQLLYAAGNPEIITLGLDDKGHGLFLPEHVPQIRESLEWCTAVVLGPGLSRSPQTRKFVHAIFDYLEVPALLDADGLMAFTAKMDLLNATEAPLVLTPHAQEFAELFDHELDEVMADPVGVLGEVRSYFPHTVVLKGAPTLTLLSTGDIVVNSTGNPGMATAGSGDILSGVIGTLLSQAYDPDEAAMLGVWMHGRAGDLARARYGMSAMTSRHILKMLPRAFTEFNQQA
ncbi:MAG: NAD(P)H-hydrate dehydratase [Candidatus Marinimicrobia bacterium]|nr:NAD(P)H-hydrate dehydratase [Candidatus Neomarinimicrobiota bacterium]